MQCKAEAAPRRAHVGALVGRNPTNERSDVSEQEVVNYLVVRIPSYGHPEKVAEQQLLEAAREAHTRYGDGAMVGTVDGKWWRYDRSRREGDRMVQCYPPDLRMGQKPFKPKPLKKQREPELADVIHMNGKTNG